MRGPDSSGRKEQSDAVVCGARRDGDDDIDAVACGARRGGDDDMTNIYPSLAS